MAQWLVDAGPSARILLLNCGSLAAGNWALSGTGSSAVSARALLLDGFCCCCWVLTKVAAAYSPAGRAALAECIHSRLEGVSAPVCNLYGVHTAQAVDNRHCSIHLKASLKAHTATPCKLLHLRCCLLFGLQHSMRTTCWCPCTDQDEGRVDHAIDNSCL